MNWADPVVTTHNLVKIHDSAAGRVQAVRGVDLELSAGTVTAVVGPSGSGKSSLLRMLAGVDTPTAGVSLVTGIDLHAMRARRRARWRSRLVSHVKQRPSDNLLSHLTARQQLVRVAGRGRPVDEVLGSLGLTARSHQLPATLSGGEQQRLALARAMVAGHPVVIADEPTATLDSAAADAVLDGIDLLAEQGTTVVLATHDARVLGHVHEIVTLRDGAVASITAGGTQFAIIDASGRLQVPPHLRAKFPTGRAKLGWDDESGHMTVEPP